MCAPPTELPPQPFVAFFFSDSIYDIFEMTIYFCIVMHIEMVLGAGVFRTVSRGGDGMNLVQLE